MIDAAALVVIVLVCVGLTVGAVVAGFWMGRTSRTQPYDPYAKAVSPDHNRNDGMFHTETTYVEPEIEEVDDEEDEPALPMDPSNPPFPRTYHRRPGYPVRTCHCHGRELEDNETVLFWPNPDVDGAFWLVCHPEEAHG